MKKVLFCLLLFVAFVSQAQVYNNEWINFDNTYYKFKVGATGLYRIPQSTLNAAGLGAVPAEQFQLWRNGNEVPLYTSVASGPLSGADYIEFWGMINDGLPDKALYRQETNQLNDKWSLESDTAVYFLTVKSSGSNFRFANTVNDVAGNSLSPEPYFMYTAGNYFKNQINGGYAVNVGTYYYSSAYDRGEGWSSVNIGTNGSNSFTFTNLFAASSGPAPLFKIAVSGNATNTRNYKASINGDSVSGQSINYLNTLRDSANFPLSLLTSGSATVVVNNVTSSPNDRMVIHKYEIIYPRQFNFGGSSNFEFTMPASAAAKFLQISGFNYGTTAPVLYDLTNGRRYTGDISSPGQVQVVLQPSAVEQKLVLVREESSNITSVNNLTSKTFTNYSLAANQANYIIISNPVLFTATNGTNQVEEYRAYRSSAAGGSYNAKIYLVDDLIDQFGFGIKRNPLGIRNFIWYARNKFSPQFVFLMGKAVNYVAQRYYESDPNMNKLGLVPSFGVPASDGMLSADPGTSDPKTPIGRLSVINGDEIRDYLNKIKEFELAQNTPSPLIRDKAWMKNVVHAVGVSEPGLLASVDGYMAQYKQIISDTLFGAKVTTFTKSSPNSVEQVNSGELNRLFADGMTLLTYFGHSSSSHLEFNLDNPDQYNNQGKYPVFIALGCNVGDYFSFNGLRFSAKETVSEQFVLAPNHGAIGFVANSHFGITDYLHVYNQRIYQHAANKSYGKSIGEILKGAISDVFAFTTQDDFYARATCEESNLNGDPAIKLNPHDKPDYVVEDSLVKASPAFVSVADASFIFKAKFLNIGKAINQPIVAQVKRQYPNGSTEIIYRDTLPGIRYADSIEINVPVDALRDKGSNKLTVTIDADNAVDELFETNNSVTKEVIVYEDEARPIYPYNFAIVNKQNIKYIVSTANPFASIKNYKFEVDTTELFNSPLKYSATQTAAGGIIEFSAPISFSDSTVYYWRVGTVPTSGQPNWTSSSSFIYLPTSEVGFNQSHFYQHLKSTFKGLYIDSTSRNWKFSKEVHNLFAKNTVFPTGSGQEGDFVVAVDGTPYIRSACLGYSLIFNVFDAVTGKPWKNVDANGNSLYLYGSASASCRPSRNWNFEFSYMDAVNRKKMMDFMDAIPDGSYVTVRNIPSGNVSQNKYVKDWIADTSLYGTNQSLYHRLKTAGFNDVDSFYKPRAFVFIYQKNSNNFVPKYTVTAGIYDIVTLSTDYYVPGVSGSVLSPKFGPAKAWKKAMWQGSSVETPGTDKEVLKLIGIRNNGNKDTLLIFNNIVSNEIDISGIDAAIYPYLQLMANVSDSVYRTPYQLKYWRLTYVPKPEGAVAPNILFNMKDTFEIGEPIDFKLAFKNISDANFDSIKVKVVITDQNNVAHVLSIPRLKPLIAGDTAQVHFPIDGRLLVGKNNLFVDVNPDNDQPEQYHFNNFIYKTFYVAPDTLHPLLDVTFDNTHILNGDIVAAKPGIVITLKDEAKYLLLNDTSLVTVQIQDPAGNIRKYHFDNDTLQFIPAQPSSKEGNTAKVNFKPYFSTDGTYTLIVKGKDKSSNQAGDLEYRVAFEVINKPMISNMLNYPNPFTSSTAFVFTITGSEVPQNLRIQILTITGKVVREISKEELGPLHVGRNITEFKWNGTDQYGQQLANGVYLYHVITNLNGKSLDKYKADGDKTDKYFTKGYGKMYLMH